MIKVFMEPGLDQANVGEGGINTVIRAYHKYVQDYGISFVDSIEVADLHAVHAASMTTQRLDIPLVVHNHGLYWTGEYKASPEEYTMNAQVIDLLRIADQITVPSEWVAKNIRKQFRRNPVILPHGVDLENWENTETVDIFSLWSKNRSTDVCTPYWVEKLADVLPDEDFCSTFGKPTKNLHVLSVLPYKNNQLAVKQARMYLSTTKETFGIGVLEALAAGTPVLGFANGGNLDLVRHKIDGYLAEPNNLEDLVAGYQFIQRCRDTLSKNAKRQAQQFTWKFVLQKLRNVYENTLQNFVKPSDRRVSVVVPVYNCGKTVAATLESLQNQTSPIYEILVVNNNSIDNSKEVVKTFSSKVPIRFLHEPKQGVAHARNTGIANAGGEYIICLDADDTLDPDFVRVTRKGLDTDRRLGVTYTGLTTMSVEGQLGNLSQFPGHYNFDLFLQGNNQVPTCAMFRKVMWERIGGYRQRFAPLGAGAEDAEFWFRSGLYGFEARKVDLRGLFHYRDGGITKTNGYAEAQWKDVHSWKKDSTGIPVAALNTPKRGSNTVFQNDEPTVSVIIPCVANHLVYVSDALDSLEYQTITQKIETIVVFNGVDKAFINSDEVRILRTSFPHVKFLFYSRAHVGYARNQGAKAATAKLLLFLDADDWLEPTALEQMLKAYYMTGAIVTGNYYGHTQIEEQEYQRLNTAGKIVYADKRGAKVRYELPDFDMELAQKQPVLLPNGQFYIWSLISALVPTAYWQCVGGFDEKMQSWEDWEFWIRLAKENIPFVKLQDYVLNYRFSTGNLRERGKAEHVVLLDYMQKKLSEYIMCCGRKRKDVPVPTVILSRGLSMKNEDGLVEVRLLGNNEATSLVSVRGTSYGMRRSGDIFYMKQEHAALFPRLFQIVGEAEVTQQQIVVPTPDSTTPDPDLTVEPHEQAIASKPNLIDESGTELVATDTESNYDELLVDFVSFSPKQKSQLKLAGILTFRDYLNNLESLANLEGFTEAKLVELANKVLEMTGE